MGSFTEMVFAVEVRPDAPEAFLAALAGARVGDGPPLPTPMPSDPDWSPDEYLADPDGVFEANPIGHQWGDVLGVDMSGVVFAGETRVSLTWRDDYQGGGTWHLTSRSVWKEGPHEIAPFVAWMAPYVCPKAGPGYPTFLGYLKYEYHDRPVLIWHDGTEITFEGLDQMDL